MLSPEADVHQLQSQAEIAQARGDMEVAGRLWAQAAAKLAPHRRGRAHYQRACCLAHGGDFEGARELLSAAVEVGLRDLEHVDSDSDLEKLRSQADWQVFRRQLGDAVAAWESTLGDPGLRRELLELAAQDQFVRRAWLDCPVATSEQMDRADQHAASRMWEIVLKGGWPDQTMVGQDGARGAWLLVQHADHDVALQSHCLSLLEACVQAGTADSVDYAYLSDRVAVNQGRAQEFGTQFDEDFEPKPIRDPANVDQRRAALGLGTLAVAREHMQRSYRGRDAKPMS